MAKTAGSITVADGAWEAGEVAGIIPWCMRIPYQPDHWDDGAYPSRRTFTMWRQHTVDAASTAIEYLVPANLDGTQNATAAPGTLSETTAGALSATWEEYDADPSISTISPLDTQPQIPYVGGGIKPAYMTGSYKPVLSAGTGAEIMVLYFQQACDELFGGPEPSQSAAYELFGSNYDTAVSGWCPFESNEPASSWLAQAVISKNQNRVLYESRQAWSVPV